MNIFGVCLLVVISYLSVYSLVDRVCRCKETCATVKGFNQFVSNKEKEEKDEEETC